MKVDTYHRRNTNCRKCKQFFVIDETNKDTCPYCEIYRLKGEINRLIKYEDAITSAADGSLLVWNLMETNCTVIRNDYWQAHLEEIDRLKRVLEDVANQCLKAMAGTACTPVEGYIKAGMHWIASDIRSLVKSHQDLERQLAEAKKEAQNYKNVLIGQGFENLDSLAYETRDTTQIGVIAKQRTEQIIAQLAEARAEVDRWKKFYPNHAAAKEDGRKEVAREICSMCDNLENEGYHYEICNHLIIKDRIKAKFKLEGVSDGSPT